jgi:Fe-S cluster biogenesis protein NfuA
MKSPTVVYAESTPNPASMKFVADRFLLQEGSVEFYSVDETHNCPFAKQLFSFSGVTAVFLTSNFVTVTKSHELEWFEITGILREFIKSYLDSGEPLFTGPAVQKADYSIEKTLSSSALESRIIEVLDEYVKPAVEQDGGAILFKSFDDGKVTLLMKGACSGCPSSTVTLKGGVERLLKQMIPEVREVIAEQS